jgi:hypothetical protein
MSRLLNSRGYLMKSLGFVLLFGFISLGAGAIIITAGVRVVQVLQQHLQKTTLGLIQVWLLIPKTIL